MKSYVRVYSVRISGSDDDDDDDDPRVTEENIILYKLTYQKFRRKLKVKDPRVLGRINDSSWRV